MTKDAMLHSNKIQQMIRQYKKDMEMIDYLSDKVQS